MILNSHPIPPVCNLALVTNLPFFNPSLSTNIGVNSDKSGKDDTEISIDIPDNDIPDISEISPSLLGVLFPHHNNETEAFSEQFNLELLEDSLVCDKVEDNDKQDILNIKVDILSDAISEIVKDTAVPDVGRPGRKRGRKLGYRSDNSNGEDALCGVCGDKVSTRTRGRNK